SLECHLRGSAAGRRGQDSVLHIVPRDRDRPLLFGPVPVRERTVFDVKSDGAIGLIDRVSADMGNASLDSGFVFLRGSGLATVGREFGNALAHHQRSIPPIAVENQETSWIGAKRFDFAAIRTGSDRCDKRPSAAKLFLETFLLADGAAFHHRKSKHRDGRGTENATTIHGSPPWFRMFKRPGPPVDAT